MKKPRFKTVVEYRLKPKTAKYFGSCENKTDYFIVETVNGKRIVIGHGNPDGSFIPDIGIANSGDAFICCFPRMVRCKRPELKIPEEIVRLNRPIWAEIKANWKTSKLLVEILV